MNPTLEGFLTFVRDVMGINTTILPDNSSVIPLAYNVAINIVNELLQSVVSQGSDPSLPSIYALAVYNLAADRLLNWGQDLPNAAEYENNLPFFKYMRKTLNLTGFIPGVIQSTNDLTTGGSYVVPKAFENFTVRDLQNLKTPYGQEYIAIAQDYGPSIWEMS